jgi:alpha-mannosidase
VAHQWTGVFSSEAGQALTCVNEGSYGSDCLDGEIRLSLLRSPGYSALRINDRPVMAVGRFSPRIDQGERVFRFWFNAGESAERAASVDSEAALHNQKPFALSFCPSGEGRTPEPLVLLEGGTVQLSAFKKAEDPADEEGYVVRLYEVSGQASATNLRIPPLGISEEVRFGAFEAVTFRVDARTRVLTRLDMTERSIEKQQED